MCVCVCMRRRFLNWGRTTRLLRRPRAIKQQRWFRFPLVVCCSRRALMVVECRRTTTNASEGSGKAPRGSRKNAKNCPKSPKWALRGSQEGPWFNP